MAMNDIIFVMHIAFFCYFCSYIYTFKLGTPK